MMTVKEQRNLISQELDAICEKHDVLIEDVTHVALEKRGNKARRPKMYMTDKARQNAIKVINGHVDKLGSIPCDVLGGYGEATQICRYLGMLIDQIIAEADEPKSLDRYARGPQEL